MFTESFIIKNHTFQGQHIRQYPGATRSHEHDVHRLHAKQYISYENQDPQKGDITIIALHGVGMFKELYEPMWEDMCEIASRQGLRIRSIWMIDASNHGGSAVLNESIQGDDPSYNDYARDVLAMINLHRDEMPAPIVGFGHSLGGTALIQLSTMHPRLFSSLILVDPIVGPDVSSAGVAMLQASTSSEDVWDSEAAAAAYARKTFQTWDRRVLRRWTDYGLCNTPTKLYPEAGKVALRTTKANYAWGIGRPLWDSVPYFGLNRVKYPDTDGSYHPFYRPEAEEAWQALPRLRPTTHYIFPDQSPMSTEKEMKRKVEQTGYHFGGSGGVKAGRVTRVVCTGGHQLPMEKPRECALLICERLAEDHAIWEEEKRIELEMREDKSIDKMALSEEWHRRVQSLYRSHRYVQRESKL